MSRTYNIFGDIEGKLTMLRVESTRCTCKGRYKVAKLIAEHGRQGNMTKWLSDLKGDRPNREHPRMQDRCDVICPDCRSCSECPKRQPSNDAPALAGCLNQVSSLELCHSGKAMPFQ
jgi:hypothetical protein